MKRRLKAALEFIGLAGLVTVLLILSMGPALLIVIALIHFW